MKKIPLVAKILTGFVLGTVVGLAMSAWCAPETVKKVVPFVLPFGAVLVAMLKMVVYPVILFSLILGAASLPIKRSGKVGALVLAWYTGTSVFATVFGVLEAVTPPVLLLLSVFALAGASYNPFIYFQF